MCLDWVVFVASVMVGLSWFHPRRHTLGQEGEGPESGEEHHGLDRNIDDHHTFSNVPLEVVVDGSEGLLRPPSSPSEDDHASSVSDQETSSVSDESVGKDEDSMLRRPQ